MAQRVLALHGHYPRWAKDNLAILLGREGRVVSTSRVGRILRRLRQRGLQRFVLPLRSPKLNGALERLQRTHTEEFYEVAPCSLQIPHLNQERLDWARTYNTLRPQQPLGCRTPRTRSPKQPPNLSSTSVTNLRGEYISFPPGRASG